MVIRSDWVTNWRTKTVYNPEVLRLLAGREDWETNWRSKDEVEYLAAQLRASDETSADKASR